MSLSLQVDLRRPDTCMCIWGTGSYDVFCLSMDTRVHTSTTVNHIHTPLAVYTLHWTLLGRQWGSKSKAICIPTLNNAMATALECMVVSRLFICSNIPIDSPSFARAIFHELVTELQHLKPPFSTPKSRKNSECRSRNPYRRAKHVGTYKECDAIAFSYHLKALTEGKITHGVKWEPVHESFIVLALICVRW